MRVRRLMLVVTLVPGVALLVLAAALAVLAATEAGTRFAVGWARDFVPPGYTFGAVRGTLVGGLEVESLDLTGEAWSATVRRVRFSWQPRALLAGRLAIQELDVEGVDVTLAPSAADTDINPPAYPRLPFAVSVATLTVEDVTLRQGEGAADSQHIERIAASVRAGRSRLDVSALEVVLERARVAGEVSVADGDVLAISARLEAQVATDERIAEATLVLAGRLDAVRVEGQVAAGLEARFGGSVDVLRSPPTFDVTVDVDAFSAGGDSPVYRFGPLRIDLAGTAAAARVTATGPVEHAAVGRRDATITFDVDRVAGDALALAGQFAWQLRTDAPTPWAELTGHGTLDYAGEHLTLTHASAAPLATTLSAVLRGLDATPELDATLVVSAVALPIPDEEPLQLEGATLTARGSAAALVLEGDLLAHQARVGPLTLAFAGTVEGARRLVLERLDVGLFDGRLAATGAVEFAADLAGHLTFTARELDLGHLLPDVDTRLGFDGRATFANPAGAPTGELIIENLAGVWREQALSGRASLAHDGTTLEVRELELALGSNTVSVTARIGDTLAGRFTLDGPDLAAFAPGLTGRLSAAGELSGSVAQPAARATVEGRGLGYGQWSIAGIQGDLDVDLASAAAQHLTLHIEDIRQAGALRGDVVLELDGTLGDHRSSVELAGGPQGARIAAHGRWVDPGWRGVVDRAEFDLGDAGAWTLAAPVVLSYADRAIAAERACLRADSASLCATVSTWSAKAGSAAIELSALPLGLFDALLPTTLRAQGLLTAVAALTQTDGQITASGHAAVADGLLVRSAEGDATETVAIPQLRAEFTLDPVALDARIAAEIDRWVSLSGDVRYGRDADGRLDGKLRARAVDLAWVEQFLPEMAGTRGAAELVASVAGSVADPVIAIEASLRDGALVVQPTGMRISTLRVSAHSRGDRRIVLDGTLGNADGTVALAGHVDLDADAGWPGQVTVKGERLAAVRLPEVEADIAPDLTIAFSTEQVDIGGSLALPRVDVDIKQLPDAAVTVSADEVIISGETATEVPEVAPDFFVDKVTGNVDLALGDDVWVTAAGLRARLTGGMRWSKVRGARVGRGAGRISIAEGGYRAYGQNLRVERGHLTFAGAIDNPELDVRAVRADIDIVAGVLVSGSVRAPNFELFSEPAMPDSDILSYIITGRGLDSASSGDASIIARAALSLGAERSSMVTSRVQDAFGLDELSVNTGATAEQTSLAAGKRLTPKLSVRSEFNPFDRLWSFFLNYKLTANWSVEAQSGARQGADVIYTIERDDLWPPAWFGDD